MSDIKIKLFGNIEVFDPAGKRIAVSGSKQQALLSFLAFNAGVPQSRDRLMDLLWGDRFTDQARQSLRQSLSKLRGFFSDATDKDIIHADNDFIHLDADHVNVDVLEFTQFSSINTPENDEQAIELYKNQIFENLYVREANFEEWILSERARINEIAYPVFERLADFYRNASEQVKSQQIAQRLVDIDPLRESSHRLLMRILAQSGQRPAAIKQFNTCADILKRELDISPEPETLNLLDEIKSPSEIDTPEFKTENTLRPSNTKPDQVAELTSKPASTQSAKTNISILPFDSMNGSDEVIIFAEGLTDEITAALAKFRWLDVIATSYAEGEVKSTPQLRELAGDKQVKYTVEGSIRQIGQRVRITAQLVDIETEKYIWVQRYDRSMDDVFGLIDELNQSIAASVETELVAHEGMRVKSKSDELLNAWDSYHLGLATQYEFSEEGNARAQSLFRRAILQDPLFAAAHARLAYALVLSAIYFEADQDSGLLDEALELAKTATRLDDKDAVARFALGRVYLARGEYEKSIAELQQSIELNPGLAQAHCGLGDSLAYLGRAKEAIPNFEEAVRLSPQDPHRWAFSTYAAIASIFDHEFEKAVDWAKSSIQVPNSHYWANSALVSALGHLGKKEDAEAAVKDLLELKPNFTIEFARERLFYLKDKSQIDLYVEGLSKAGLR